MSKAEELAKKVSDDLNSLIGLYLGNTGDSEHNETLFEEFNEKWKEYVYTVNNRQKRVKVSPFAFQEELKNKLENLKNQ